VWLVAGGATFFLAFPSAYAVAFSGMYLPLIMVLWLLVLRGVSIELRGQSHNPLWQSGWDAVFASSSAVMALVLGVAIGNVIRGFPIGPSGWFTLTLFSLGTRHEGAIGAYTGLVGLLSVALLAAHGATYLAWKSEGEIHERAVAAARRAWPVALVLFAGATAATALVRPSLFVSLAHRPWASPLPAAAIASAVIVLLSLARGREHRAFLASCAFIASVLGTTAAVLFPALLPSTVDSAYTLDAYKAASGELALSRGLLWFIPGLALAAAYFVNLFRLMRGKTKADQYGH
jgi:cytochrome d ubiquinol oxidase subunit II